MLIPVVSISCVHPEESILHLVVLLPQSIPLHQTPICSGWALSTDLACPYLEGTAPLLVRLLGGQLLREQFQKLLHQVRQCLLKLADLRLDLGSDGV
jgi:hypothetical protein